MLFKQVTEVEGVQILKNTSSFFREANNTHVPHRKNGYQHYATSMHQNGF